MLQTRLHVKDGQMTVQTTQDCTAIAESAKARHNEGMHGTSEMKHAARIPNIMIEKYMSDNGITYQEWCANPSHIRRMLQDPALAHFRIWKGAV